MIISDIMSKKVHTIGPEISLKECAKLLEKYQVNGFIVVKEDKVVGVITKADIFRAILPQYSDIIEDEQYMMTPEYIEERVFRYYEIKVKEIMGAPPITISSDMPVIKAGSMMTLRKIKQLPVVDNDKLVGIVTFTDILNGLLKKVI